MDERRVLGMLVTANGDLPPGVRARIVPSLFSNGAHALIAGVLEELHGKGESTDIVGLCSRLTAAGRIEEAGGAEFITTLPDFGTTPAFAVPYIARLEAEATRRLSREAMRRALKSLDDDPEGFTPDQVIAELSECGQPIGREATRYTVSEIIKHQPDPARVIAGDGWLRRGAWTLLTGSTGTGKSILAMQIGLCIAAGERIFKGFCNGIEVRQPWRVLYVQAENDIETLQRDLAGILFFEALPPKLVNANLTIIHHVGAPPDEFGPWLTRTVRDERPDLIVIDPLDCFIGNVDKNSTQSFYAFRDAVAPAARDAALLLITHCSKPREREGWTARDSVYLAAGTSAIANYARCSAELTNPESEQDERYRLRFGKNAERTGLRDAAGRMVRDVFLQHSADAGRPHWRVSECQESNSELPLKQRIASYFERYPDASTREVADLLGCAQSTVVRHRKKEGQNDK